jgi:hypothetical protein
MNRRFIPSALVVTLGAALGAALSVGAAAQSLPAGLGGYWKITKMIPKKPAAGPGCTPNPAFFSKEARGSVVLISDRSIVWGAASATDPAPQVSMVPPEEFMASHAAAGATLADLQMDSGAKLQVIQLSAPGTLPFDTIVVKDPSSVYFERCGLFMEAIHSSGFVAPPLPNR